MLSSDPQAAAYLELACRSAAVGVFLLSVVGKARTRSAFRAFAGSLTDLRLVRRAWAGPLALATVLAEAGAIVLLVVPVTARLGLVAATALSVTLAAGLVLSLRRGSRAPCHCFGASAAPVTSATAVRAAVLATVCGAGLATHVTARAPTPHPGGVALALGTGLVAAVVVRYLDEILEAFSSPASSP